MAKDKKKAKGEAKKAMKARSKAMKKAALAESNKRLRKSGFARTRGGYTFPGADNKEIERAAKFKKVAKKKGKEGKVAPEQDPKMGI